MIALLYLGVFLFGLGLGYLLHSAIACWRSKGSFSPEDQATLDNLAKQGEELAERAKKILAEKSNRSNHEFES